MQWQTGNPERCGYYLAAVRRTECGAERLRVSELYFNPQATFQWSCGRAAFGQMGYGVHDVVAWMDLPDPPATSI